MAYALEQGYRTFAYSGELPNYLYKSWFDFQIAGRHHIVENKTDFGTLNRFLTKANQELINAWYMERAYIYDNRIVENDEKEDLLKSIERSIQQYGTKVILIDNLMTAMYIDEQRGSDKYDQQVFYCKRRQQAVHFMVMLLPYQNQSRKIGNHQATGITAHVGCKFGK